MPESTLPPKRRIHPSIPFVVILLVLGYLALNVLIFFYGTKIFNFSPRLKEAASTVSIVKDQGGSFGTLPGLKPTPTPRPVKPLPSGKQEYTFSHGKNVVGPKIGTAVVDPLTPVANGNQTLTVTIKHDSPVTDASVTLVTDTKREQHSLQLASGTTSEGTWAASWKMTDTYNYTYRIEFRLQSATDIYTGGLTFRE